MRSVIRYNCLALVLILLVAHAAFSFHVTTHIPVGQTSCELCTGHANPAHAIPPAAIELPRLIAFMIGFDYFPLAARAAEPTPYRQRGPPASIQIID